MATKHPSQAFGPVVNRFGDVMAHTSRYAFGGVTKLAHDSLVAPSSVSRLMRGNSNPSFVLVARLTAALEKELGYRIDPRDLVAEYGKFMTDYTCDLCECTGCLPEKALNEFGDVMPPFIGVQPGRWITSRYPKGYRLAQKGGPHA